MSPTADALDAVVVGSGPNGLAAAVVLAAAGLRVRIYEGADTPGGGCRTQESTLPGFSHDICSAVHPLAVASPFFQRFDLRAHGVRLAWPEVQFAHPLDSGSAGAVVRSVPDTAAALGIDAVAYRRLVRPFVGHADDVVPAVLSSLRRVPPSPWRLIGFGLRASRSAQGLAGRFRTDEARGLLAGIAAHAMLPLDRLPTGALGLLLGGLAHTAGWPLVQEGSARITTSMVEAVVGAGGEIVTGHWVRSLTELPPAPITMLDVTPRALLGLTGDRLPPLYRRALGRFRYGPGVCKVDYALAGPVPWRAESCRRAGTVHVGGTFEEIARSEADVAAGRHPQAPYVLVVQPGVVDPSRAPRGQGTLWTYCHVPSGSTVDMTAAIEDQLERFAPGFRDLVLARSVRTAADEGLCNPNYVGGDIAAGTQDLRQTIFRPTPRWEPYRTPLPGVYLCSSSTPPGPGVHGRCGELAALSALRHELGIRTAPNLAPAAHPADAPTP